ncbi:tRNA lysidine(34) synthetase TilS [Maricaulis salignorans]|uniref:tRNA lysidine(34) synthetase TilS n=1 Tax=Maricaulis salignorans TaxID=144026 RepID=UPI003A92F0AE
MRAGADFPARLNAWLDRHHPGPEPIALGYSGGGDSHALLCLTANWARARGIVLHALIVDHGLRPQSAAEARQAMVAARRLGAAPQVLRWSGDKPVTGLQAAARQARHVLLAQACRARGIDQLLLAHTGDDQAETVWMRLQAGAGWRGCASMAERVASPVWPQGRGVEILRPLLDARRAELREYLTVSGERWIEDPSNQDTHYTRIRIRQRLEALEAAGFVPGRLNELARDLGAIERSERLAVAAAAREAVRFHPWGGAQLDIDRLMLAAPVIRRRLVETLALAISGRAVTARQSGLDGLVERVLNGGSGSAAGVQSTRWRGGSWMFRDPGAVLGRVDRPGGKSLDLKPDTAQVWDGRYEIETSIVNIIAEPLGKGYKGIGVRRDLETIPGPARTGLLTLRCEGEVLAIAGVRHHPDVGIVPLMEQRFHSRLLCDPAFKPGLGQPAPA